MTDKRVHIDTLEYTRQGLRTKAPLQLKLGQHHRIVLVRPERVTALALGSGAFDRDGCFPTPGVLSPLMLAAAQDLANAGLGLSPSSIFQVYGHAESSGDEGHNKALSDRRAQVVHACLRGDVQAMRAMAKTQGWGLREHQVMLRVLKCDPGAIDGADGVVTQRATRLFQREYEAGVFHRHLAEVSASRALSVSGELDPDTVDALVEAYVWAVSPQLPVDRMHPTHPVAGCSEYNQLDLGDPKYNRRVSLVVHAELPPYHDAAPCTEGDHEVCPVDKGEPGSRCGWYRQHVLDPARSELKHRHFDLRWLSLPNGNILLSALTTLPEGEEIEFQAYRSQPLGSQSQLTPEMLGDGLSEPMKGIIRGGVAQVVWDPPEGFELFGSGLKPFGLGDIHRLRYGQPEASMPVFVCRGGGVETVSPPPGREVVRVPFEGVETDGARRGVGAVDWFGRFFQQSSHPRDRPAPEQHPLRDDEPRIWGTRWVLGGSKEPQNR